MSVKTIAVASFWFLILAVAPASADAQPANSDMHLRYEVYWGGLHAADFRLSARRTEGHYEHAFRLRTHGVFDWILTLDVTARGTGLLVASRALAPTAYNVDFTNRWRRGDIAMHFDPASGDVESTYRSEPPRENQGDREGISAEERRGALDPLAAFLEAVRRAGTDLIRGERTFRLKVFDGRRRFDASGEVIGIVNKHPLDSKQDTLHLRLTTLPVAGFNRRQMELWGGKVYDVYLSTDGRLVPIKISGDGMGPHINLVEECATATACQLPGEGAPKQTLESRAVQPPG